jgi:hypothetical protein
MKYVKGYIAVVGISALAACCVFLWLPDYRYLLYTEDQLVENLTAGFFLISFLLSLFLFFKSKTHQKGQILISMLGLLGFLDELSYGERLFQFKMPQLYGVKIDAVHDIFYLGYDKIKGQTNSALPYVLLGLGVCIATAAILVWKYRHQLKGAFSDILHEQTRILALFFAILAILSLVLDLGFMRHSVRYVAEELFEMFAAIALLFCSLSLYGQRLPRDSADGC